MHYKTLWAMGIQDILNSILSLCAWHFIVALFLYLFKEQLNDPDENFTPACRYN